MLAQHPIEPKAFDRPLSRQFAKLINDIRFVENFLHAACEAVHVAWIPSPVMAGISNVCAELPGM